jgi:hypothetical protein
MLGISCLDEKLLVSQEGLCCMELVQISIKGLSWNFNFLRSELHITQRHRINGRRHSASSDMWGCILSLEFEKRESGRGTACRKAVFSGVPENNSRYLGQERRHYDPIHISSHFTTSTQYFGRTEMRISFAQSPRRYNTSNAVRLNSTVHIWYPSLFWRTYGKPPYTRGLWSRGRYTLSVKLSNFSVWRHTWPKNWANCAVSKGNSAGLRTVLSSRLTHRELRSLFRESHTNSVQLFV